jgi:methionyl-tRNA formyltransferase
MLKKNDGLIDWSQPAVIIYNRLRGMTPWPGCFTLFEGRILKIHAAGVRDMSIGAAVPGTVLQAEGQGITVATGCGALVISRLQLEGKKQMSAGDFLQGTGVQSGTVLGNESVGS